LARMAAFAVMSCAALREAQPLAWPSQQPRLHQKACDSPLHYAAPAPAECSQTRTRQQPLPTTLATQRSRGARGFLLPEAAATHGRKRRRTLAPCLVVQARPRLQAVAIWSLASTLFVAEALLPVRRSARQHREVVPSLRRLTPLSFRHGTGSAAGHWLQAELAARVSRPSADGKTPPWVGLAVDATAPLATARPAATLASSKGKNAPASRCLMTYKINLS